MPFQSGGESAMKEQFDFFAKIPKETSGLFIVYELFTFYNFFRLLLKSGLNNEEALHLILARSSLSAYVFQEVIHNGKYKTITTEGVLPPDHAFCRAELIYDLWSVGYGKGAEKP
jgi:hypothetical protein